MSIHSRRATTPVLNLIKDIPKSGTPVMHWYTGNKTELEFANSLGCWYSIGMPMLSTQKGLEIVRKMPPDMILTETDGPFSKILGKPAMPWDVEQTVNKLAPILGKSSQSTEQLLHDNLKRLVQNII